MRVPGAFTDKPQGLPMHDETGTFIMCGFFFGVYEMPTRYLKPGVRDSQAIDGLSPLAETLFYRLLVTVDDFGRYDGRPAMIKAHCFPIKDWSTSKVAGMMDELKAAGIIQIYQVDGKPYLQMQKWDNVPRAKESKYPAIEYGCIQVHTNVPLTETETETETGDINRNRNLPKGVSAEADFSVKKEIVKDKKKKEKESVIITRPDFVSERVWNDWITVRKKKGAPTVTETAWELIVSQAQKAGYSIEDALKECCLRNWVGFKAEWLESKTGHSGAGVNKQLALEERNRQVGKQWLKMMEGIDEEY